MWSHFQLLVRSCVAWAPLSHEIASNRRSFQLIFGLALLAAPGSAQQRSPAFEIYGLAGAHRHGNLSASTDWKPQFGAGFLAPLGRNWGFLADVTTSQVEAAITYDGIPPASGRVDNFVRERKIVVMPSIVRLWRRDRFSIYGGGGLAAVHEREFARFQPIIDRGPNGQPVLGPVRDNRASSTQSALLLRFGTLVSLAPRIALRAGYSFLPRYIDESPAASLEIGIGYRF